MLDPRPARTAWEVARLAGVLVPTVRGELDAAAAAFNDVVYGDRPPSAQIYRDLGGWADRIIAEARNADLAAAEDDATPVRSLM